MPNYKARNAGLLTKVETYEATSAEASHVFTITSDDFTNTAYYLLVLDGGVTASLIMELEMNGVTAGSYFFDGRRIIGGAETLLDQDAQTEIDIMSASLLTGVTQFFCRIYINYSDVGANTRLLIQSTANAGTAGQEVITGQLNDDAPLTEIKISTSTSTWAIGTRMTLYKMTRS